MRLTIHSYTNVHKWRLMLLSEEWMEDSAKGRIEEMKSGGMKESFLHGGPNQLIVEANNIQGPPTHPTKYQYK